MAACCRADLDFLQKNIDATVLERLKRVASAPFQRITYTEAVDILTKAIQEKKKKFENSKVNDVPCVPANPLTLGITVSAPSSD